MRVIFLGTPDFGVKELKEIAKLYDVVAVVTQPDRARDRGKVIKSCPVKVCAESLNIPVLQYEKISREGVEELRALQPDIMVTAAYGQILSQEILDIAKFGVINIHASLLPKYRGAAPIQWAIINGEIKTGVTIMQTARGVDTGDIILQKETDIGATETASELFDRLSDIGAEAVIEALERIASGTATYTKQNVDMATHCSQFTKADGQLHFEQTAKQLVDRVRAIACYFTYENKIYKVYKAQAVQGSGEIGTVIDNNKRLVIACKDGAVEILSIQAEGGKRMDTQEYLKGHSFPLNAKVNN